MRAVDRRQMEERRLGYGHEVERLTN